MAMPDAGPKIGWPRPAISRSKVDLPDPERPSSPTICPSRNSRFIPSSTSNSAPSGLGNALRTSVHCSNGELFMGNPLGQSIFALGVVIQGPPEEPVDDDHEQAHGADTQDDAMKIPGGRRLCDVRPEASCLHVGVSPTRQFGDDGRIPRP